MKIEVGKFYKTRSGLKARIYQLYCGGKWPIHGAIFEHTNDEEWDECSWTPGGLMNHDPTSDGDIVSEWIEPKKKAKLYAFLIKYSNGLWEIRYWHNESFGDVIQNYQDFKRVPGLDQEVEQ